MCVIWPNTVLTEFHAGFNEADNDMNYLGWLEFDEINKPGGAVGAKTDMISCTHIGNTLGDHYIYGCERDCTIAVGLRLDPSGIITP